MRKLPNPLSHAYILTGGGEESRMALARQLTAAYLCEGGEKPCGTCRHCVKVEKDIHPDVYPLTLLEDKREIQVAQIRTLRRDAYVMPNEGARKVFLIYPAEAMNQESQNALLKVLEDGPAYAAFLLLAEQPGLLLETIRSRCETLSLPPEEKQADGETAALAEELGALLLRGSEWDIARRFAQLEGKLKGQGLFDLLTAVETVVARSLTADRRAAKVLGVLRRCRDFAVYNANAGHVLGWLCGELFH